jgi:hypothetical protein
MLVCTGHRDCVRDLVGRIKCAGPGHQPTRGSRRSGRCRRTRSGRERSWHQPTWRHRKRRYPWSWSGRARGWRAGPRHQPTGRHRKRRNARSRGGRTRGWRAGPRYQPTGCRRKRRPAPTWETLSSESRDRAAFTRRCCPSSRKTQLSIGSRHPPFGEGAARPTGAPGSPMAWAVEVTDPTLAEKNDGHARHR